MFHSFRKALLALGALGALALGAPPSPTPHPTGRPARRAPPAPPRARRRRRQRDAGAAERRAATRPDKPGGHRGRNGKTEEALSSDVAAKVKAAALAKVPGATFERAETDVDHGSPYEAHLRKADGTELEVLVNKDFQVTAVNTMQHP